MYFIVSISGNPSFPGTYSQHVIILFCISVILYLYKVYFKTFKTIKKNLLRKIFISNTLFLMMIITYIINSNLRLISPIAYLLQFLAVSFLTEIIDESIFKNVFVRLVLVLSVASIILYAVPIFFPKFVTFFPSKFIPEMDNRYYYNAVFYSYIGYYGGTYYLPRNNGIMWEPGAYQAIVNLALFYTLWTDVNLKDRKTKMKYISVFIATVLTTASTTGIVILIFQIVAFLIGRRKVKINIKYMLPVLLILLNVLLLLPLLNIDIKNAMLKLTDTEGVLSRLSIFTDLSTLFTNNSFDFLGVTFETQLEYVSVSGNSITSTIGALGIPFTFLVLSLYYLYSIKTNHRYILFTILILIFSTEGFLLKPIFLMLLMYSQNNVSFNTIGRLAIDG